MKLENTIKTELLAPAGSYESFIAAINAGADAVYMGLKNFNARVMTDNFDTLEYIEAIDYAHKRNVKVYLTLNTLLLDEEIKEAVELVYELYKVGLDGVIVQDLGVASIIHKVMPNLSLHASTQMSVFTLEQVKLLERLGFSRVVLARELSIEEIKLIAQNAKLEIEVFVHGALCVSVSGQCLMSAMIGNRSANRGSCAGPCRKKYSLYNISGKLIEKNKYLLSKKDIFGLDKLKSLVEAGVTSLKIEGRNKTPEYVAGVVRNYRQALDKGYNELQDKEVLQLFNRSGKSDGYLEKIRYKESISEFSPKNTGIYLGKVVDIKKDYIKIKIETDINLHDGIESIGQNKTSTIITCIRDDKFKVINKKVEKGNSVWLGDVSNVKIGDEIFKTSSNELTQKLSVYVKSNMKKIEYDVCVEINENQRINAKTDFEQVEIDYIPEKSKTSSVNENKVYEAFSKTEETSVIFNVTCNIQQGLFVPSSKLNELRKALIEKIEQQKIVRQEIQNIDEIIKSALKIPETGNEVNNKKVNSLYVYRYNNETDYIKWYKEKYKNDLDVIYIGVTDFLSNEKSILNLITKCKVYFVIPNVTLKNTTKYITENLERLCNKGITGVLLGNLGFIDMCCELKEKYNIEIIADYSLNIMNRYTTLSLKHLGIDRVTPLFENDDVNLENINKVLPIEIVQDLATVMTTRYCVIASFVKNAKEQGLCKAECKKSNYYLVDELNKRYEIVCDSLDCISRYVRNKRQYSSEEEKQYSTRHNILQNF